jgi:glycosyltransferase involved in cell wall biosynthesis
MLFIYGALSLGGIETFFLRMAKERYKLGLNTTILLLSKPENSNEELLREMKLYSSVYFPGDIFSGISLISRKLPLLAPISKVTTTKIFDNIDQVHTFDGMHALLGARLSKLSGKKLPITIGFYHYIKYLWGGNNVAHYEKVNRQFIFDYLPKKALMFFSEGNKELYEKHKGYDFTSANTFRLGVVDKKGIDNVSGDLTMPLRIIAIGRLVEFKTYNFYMIDVIKSLTDKGIQVQFDIYGDGPLKNEIQGTINHKGVSNFVTLKGTLDYSKFDETVSAYNLFIGSGTAIIQASALGLPSIVGTENIIKPYSYGFFSNVHQFEYNLKGLDIPLLSVEAMIEEYVTMKQPQREELIESHIKCIDNFTNETCQKAMNNLNDIQMPVEAFKFNRWVYETSRVIDRVNMRFNKKHPYNQRHKNFRKMNEI